MILETGTGVERLRAALENLDQAIDMAENALQRRNKDFEKIVEAKAAKRVKAATETAERALVWRASYQVITLIEDGELEVIA